MTATARNPVKEVREAFGFSPHEMAHEIGCART